MFSTANAGSQFVEDINQKMGLFEQYRERQIELLQKAFPMMNRADAEQQAIFMENFLMNNRKNLPEKTSPRSSELSDLPEDESIGDLSAEQVLPQKEIVRQRMPRIPVRTDKELEELQNLIIDVGLDAKNSKDVFGVPQLLKDAIQISNGIDDEELIIIGYKIPGAIKFLIELTPIDNIIKIEKAYDKYQQFKADGKPEKAKAALAVVMMNIAGIIPVKKGFDKFKDVTNILGKGFSKFSRALRLARIARYNPDAPTLRKIFNLGKGSMKLSKKVLERKIFKNFSAPQALGVTLLSDGTFNAIELAKKQFIKKGYSEARAFKKIVSMKKLIKKQLVDRIPKSVKKFMKWDELPGKVQEKVLDDIFDGAFESIAGEDKWSEVK